jgi:hypothetical protein
LAVKRLRAAGSMRRHDAGAISRSLRGAHMQNSTWPGRQVSLTIAPLPAAPTSPCVTAPAQLPQTPLRHE